MSALFTQIKADQLAARKACNTPKTLLLTTLIGETALIGKNENREVTDNEVLKVMKKFIDGISDCLRVEKDALKIANLHLEKSILEGYLPSQLTKTEMEEIVIALRVGSDKLEVKEIMQHFKQYYLGRYDGKFVSEFAKDCLTSQV